jgi:hypothetical protein
MPRDPYDEDDREPPKKDAGASLSITKNVGPLPVWGWGAVIIAAVFLWRRIGGGANPAAAAATVTGPQPPAYTPATGGVYLLPGTNPAPGGTGTTPAPEPVFLPAYPSGGGGKAPPGQQCAPGRVLVQGPNGYTCATAQEAITLGEFLQAVKSGAFK